MKRQSVPGRCPPACGEHEDNLTGSSHGGSGGSSAIMGLNLTSFPPAGQCTESGTGDINRTASPESARPGVSASLPLCSGWSRHERDRSAGRRGDEHGQ